MTTHGKIDYLAKLPFDAKKITKAHLESKAFKDRMRQVWERTEAIVESSRRVDSEKLSQRFGS